MRVLKSLLVALIGLSALLYAVQNLANIRAMRDQIGAQSGASLAASWTGFALVTLCQLAIAAIALRGGWALFDARKGTREEYQGAKLAAVWAGGLSLVAWFGMSLMVGSGLFEWGTETGADALNRSFALGTTSALTVLFVWGTTD